MDASKMLQSTELWQYLNTIHQDYAQRCVTFVELTSGILDTISEHFPFYTEHNSVHSYQILRRMTQILRPESLDPNSSKSLSYIESYLLICSSYSHDIGMTIFPGEDEEILALLHISRENGWKTHINLQNYLRDQHSKRGYDYLLKNYEDLQIPINLLDYLNRLMVAHNQSTYKLKIDSLKKHAAGSQILNLEQLAAILCIADALEFSDTRVKDGVLSRLKELLAHEPDSATISSYRENMKNACIESNVTVDPTGEIVVDGTFLDAEVLNLAHKTLDDIQSWIRDYIEIDNKYSVPRLRIRTHIIDRHLKYAYGEFEQLGIRMKKENIINLISSNSVWGGSNTVVVKELLQNSVEACRYRHYNSAKAEMYNPEITVTFDEKARTIVVEDNGCGMSKDVILNNFLTVGNSRSFESDYKRKGYHSIAKFGIGFWSVFTISENAQIQTGTFESSGAGLKFDVSINIFKDFTVLTPCSRPSGTTIKLFIKQDIQILEIYRKLKNQVICSEIPIKVINNGSIEIIRKEPSLPTMQEIFGPKLYYAQEQGVETFYYDEIDGDYTFKMLITYRMDRKKPTFLFDSPPRSIRWLHHEVSNLTETAICGFVTTLPSVYTVFQNNAISEHVANTKNPEGFIFNINRRSLLQSAAMEQYTMKLSTFLHKGYYHFLKKTNSLGIEDVYNITEESKNGMSGGIGTDEVQIANAIKLFPQLFVFKLHCLRRHKLLQNTDVVYEDLSTLMSNKYSIVSYEPSFSQHNMTHIDERWADNIFLILSSLIEFQGCYFHTPNHRVGILFDRSRTSYVYNLKLHISEGKPPASITLVIVNSSEVNMAIDSDSLIGNIRGIWSGSIWLKRVVNHNFAFGYYRFYINPNTKLADDIIRLYGEGKHQVVAEIINLLVLSDAGYMDEKILSYL